MAALLLPVTALAALERVGPTASANGFPAWYQDSTGVTLDFCSPSAAELADGWCLLTSVEVPNPPEVFPNNFFDEHFWFAADAAGTYNGDRIILVLALEAAFSADVAPGNQLAFGRLRIRVDNVPTTGTYRFYTP
jgi:hypothetical protein